MNQFVARVANWLANEVIVKNLVKNKQFQNMAMRTHLRVEKTKETAKQSVEEVAQAVEKEVFSQQGRMGGGEGIRGGMRPPPKGGIGGFVQAFVKEGRRGWGLDDT
jgi:hypothetical protein